MKDSPCKECTERKVTKDFDCHKTCEKYKNWKRDMKYYNKKLSEERALEKAIDYRSRYGRWVMKKTINGNVKILGTEFLGSNKAIKQGKKDLIREVKNELGELLENEDFKKTESVDSLGRPITILYINLTISTEEE